MKTDAISYRACKTRDKAAANLLIPITAPATDIQQEMLRQVYPGISGRTANTRHRNCRYLFFDTMARHKKSPNAVAACPEGKLCLVIHLNSFNQV